jgi:flagellar FliL protein
MSKETDAQPAAAPAEKPPGVLKWVAIGIALALVAGGTAGGVLWFLLRPAAPAVEAAEGEHAEGGEATEAKKPAEPKAVVALEPFLVNLADTEANRFVRVTLHLAVESEHEAELIAKNPVHKARLRSAIIETLAQETSARLVTADGKAALKSALAERCTKALGDLKVLDVLFTDFVVQF